MGDIQIYAMFRSAPLKKMYVPLLQEHFYALVPAEQ